MCVLCSLYAIITQSLCVIFVTCLCIFVALHDRSTYVHRCQTDFSHMHHRYITFILHKWCTYHVKNTWLFAANALYD